MSGISRIALRFVGTNIATCRRSMTLTTNHSIHSSTEQTDCNATEAKKIFNHLHYQAKPTLWTTVLAAGKAILPDKNVTSDMGDFKVSLCNGRAVFSTQDQLETCSFTPTLCTELNGDLIAPKNDIPYDRVKKPVILSGWEAITTGNEKVLFIQVRDFGFGLKHTVHVGARISPQKIKNTTRHLDYDITPLPLEMSIKTEPSSSKTVGAPNGCRKIELQFPISITVKNQQIIKLKDTNDTFTVLHTIRIQAYEQLYERLESFEKIILPELDVFLMGLESDLLIQLKHSKDKSIKMKHTLDIAIDLDSKVPTILINSHPENFIGQEIY